MSVLNKQDTKSTRLHLAAQYNRVDDIDDFLDQGDDIDSQDSEGYTPLHTAIVFGNLEIVKTLLWRGANPNHNNNVNKNTPLHLAAFNANKKIVEILLLWYEADPNIPNKNGLITSDLTNIN